MTTLAAPTRPRSASVFLREAVRRGATVWFIVGILLVVLTVMRGGSFWSIGNIAALLTSAVVLGIVALGQHTVVIAGGIDLSIGANVTMTTLLTAVLIDGYPIRTFPVVIGVIALGAAIGLVNGLLVTKAGLPPFIVTLAMLYLVSGAALWVSSTPAGQVTSALTDFAVLRFGPVPAPFLVFLVLLVVVWFLLTRTPWGKHLFAVGGDEQSARFAGLSVGRVQTLAFVLAGALAGVAGVLLAARSAIGSPTAGDGLELSAIAAVVIGGTSLMGGRGRLLGTVGGVALLALITNSITVLQFPSTMTDLIRGVIIIAAVAIFVAKRRS